MCVCGGKRAPSVCAPHSSWQAEPREATELRFPAGLTCGDSVESDGFRDSPSQSHAHPFKELLLGEKVLVPGQNLGEAQGGIGAGCDGNLGALNQKGHLVQRTPLPTANSRGCRGKRRGRGAPLPSSRPPCAPGATPPARGPTRERPPPCAPLGKGSCSSWPFLRGCEREQAPCICWHRLSQRPATLWLSATARGRLLDRGSAPAAGTTSSCPEAHKDRQLLVLTGILRTSWRNQN